MTPADIYRRLLHVQRDELALIREELIAFPDRDNESLMRTVRRLGHDLAADLTSHTNDRPAVSSR